MTFQSFYSSRVIILLLPWSPYQLGPCPHHGVHIVAGCSALGTREGICKRFQNKNKALFFFKKKDGYLYRKAYIEQFLQCAPVRPQLSKDTP